MALLGTLGTQGGILGVPGATWGAPLGTVGHSGDGTSGDTRGICGNTAGDPGVAPLGGGWGRWGQTPPATPRSLTRLQHPAAGCPLAARPSVPLSLCPSVPPSLCPSVPPSPRAGDRARGGHGRTWHCHCRGHKAGKALGAAVTRLLTRRKLVPAGVPPGWHRGGEGTRPGSHWGAIAAGRIGPSRAGNPAVTWLGTWGTPGTWGTVWSVGTLGTWGTGVGRDMGDSGVSGDMGDRDTRNGDTGDGTPGTLGNWGNWGHQGQGDCGHGNTGDTGVRGTGDTGAVSPGGGAPRVVSVPGWPRASRTGGPRRTRVAEGHAQPLCPRHTRGQA